MLACLVSAAILGAACFNWLLELTLRKVRVPIRPTATNYVHFLLSVEVNCKCQALLLLRCPQLHVHEQSRSNCRSSLSCNLSNVLTDLHLEYTAGMLV